MEVWKFMFLSKWVICRFNVRLPGCLIFLFFFLRISGSSRLVHDDVIMCSEFQRPKRAGLTASIQKNRRYPKLSGHARSFSSRDQNDKQLIRIEHNNSMILWIFAYAYTYIWYYFLMTYPCVFSHLDPELWQQQSTQNSVAFTGIIELPIWGIKQRKYMVILKEFPRNK